MTNPLIILGASARAAAASAIRAGYAPWCIDLFADRDLRAMATAQPCPADRYPMGMLPLLERAPAKAPVLLTGAMENHPKFLEAVAFEHRLLGPSPQAMQQVRDPHAIASLPPFPGLKLPKTRTFSGPLHRLGRLTPLTRQYLIKPRASAGGVSIETWSPFSRIGRDRYIQQRIRGQPLSAVYRADGWSAALIGVTEQLIGEPAFGADGYRYCGSIGPVSLSEKSRKALAHLGVVLAQRFDMRGLFGVDLVMDWRGRLWPVEVNPRYTASIEVIERATDLATLASPRDAAARPAPKPTGVMHGKAILFAQANVRAGDLYDQLPNDQLADVPDPGRLISAGRPVCTIFASAPRRDECEKALSDRAECVYDALEAV